MTDVLTPEELVRSIEAGLMAERKRVQEHMMGARDASLRVKKAEKLLRAIRRTFNLPEPEPAVFTVGPSPRPLGIEVIDEQGARLYPCDFEGCRFITRYANGLGPHRAMHRRQAHLAIEK